MIKESCNREFGLDLLVEKEEFEGLQPEESLEEEGEEVEMKMSHLVWICTGVEYGLCVWSWGRRQSESYYEVFIRRAI